MGRAVARLLYSRGANIVIVARNEAKLKAAVTYIEEAKKSPSQWIRYISADLTDAAATVKMLEQVKEMNGGQAPDIVWGLAGMSVPKLFIDADVETLRQQMDVNYWTGAYLAHATLKMWYGPHVEEFSAPPEGDKKSAGKASGPKAPARHFILTSSVAGFVGVAGYGTYSPSKAALRSLCDSLDNEVKLYTGAFEHSGTPVPETKVHLIVPGNISTPGHIEEDKTKHPVTFALEKDDPVQTEDQCAAAAVAGLDNGDYLIMTNWLAKLVRFASISGSPRNGLGLLDTFMSGITNFAWLFIRPDMDSTVLKWGRTNGVYGKDGRKG